MFIIAAFLKACVNQYYSLIDWHAENIMQSTQPIQAVDTNTEIQSDRGREWKWSEIPMFQKNKKRKITNGCVETRWEQHVAVFKHVWRKFALTKSDMFTDFPCQTYIIYYYIIDGYTYRVTNLPHNWTCTW